MVVTKIAATRSQASNTDLVTTVQFNDEGLPLTQLVGQLVTVEFADCCIEGSLRGVVTDARIGSWPSEHILTFEGGTELKLDIWGQVDIQVDS